MQYEKLMGSIHRRPERKWIDAVSHQGVIKSLWIRHWSSSLKIDFTKSIYWYKASYRPWLSCNMIQGWLYSLRRKCFDQIKLQKSKLRGASVGANVFVKVQCYCIWLLLLNKALWRESHTPSLPCSHPDMPPSILCWPTFWLRSDFWKQVFVEKWQKILHRWWRDAGALQDLLIAFMKKRINSWQSFRVTSAGLPTTTRLGWLDMLDWFSFLQFDFLFKKLAVWEVYSG